MLLPYVVPQPVSFHAGSNLRSCLVRASAVLPLPSNKGCYKCGLPDCVLNMLLLETDQIQCSYSGKVFNNCGNITCTSQNIVYGINCLECKLQGAGECRHPNQRLLSYYMAIRGRRVPAIVTCIILKHFLRSDHSACDLQFIFLYLPSINGPR